jgi:hypothetical protein
VGAVVEIPIQDVRTFIAATFRTVWALEVLCHLLAEPNSSFPKDVLVQSLRASNLVIEQSLANLTAAGLASVDETGSAQYAPASADLAALAEATQKLYATSPDAVRRIIVTAANPGITAFANAFKLKGE